MEKAKYHIIPYEASYDDALQALEQQSPQGKLIQLEMVKTHFLSRAQVFDQFAAYLAIDKNKQLLGVYLVAVVDVRVNGRVYRSGIPFDARVAEPYRGQGIGKAMLFHLWEDFFIPRGIENMITTMKASNDAVLKVSGVFNETVHQYAFSYLTIPTYKRVEQADIPSEKQGFFIRYWPGEKDLHNYFQAFEGGLKIWKTHNLYQLRLKKIHPAYRLGSSLANLLLPADRKLPRQGDHLSFAFLYDLDSEKFPSINQVLDHLQKEGIQYLSVGCRQEDAVYRKLKPLAINAYRYSLLSSFHIAPDDLVEMDVRCF